jgi:aspartyl-tRNA(Asn)/glutamyl-tRNA(Gln) amidotransferase subunit C
LLAISRADFAGALRDGVLDFSRTGGMPRVFSMNRSRRADGLFPFDRALDKRARGIYQDAHMSSPNLDVRDVARLARIELSDEEAATFQAQLGSVLEYVEQLGKLDVSQIEPTAHAAPVFNVFREDVAKPGLERTAVLANAPHAANNLVIVTKVIEQP